MVERDVFANSGAVAARDALPASDVSGACHVSATQLDRR